MIKRINAKNFRRYGWVIEYPHKNLKSRNVNLWKVILSEKACRGWRIAFLVLRDKTIKRLEQHPGSFESFEPVKGKSLIFVSRKKDVGAIECFHLDAPVILKKGIWHGVVTVSRETEIKITENAKVRCVYWPLGFPFDKKGKSHGMHK